jgi:hypothetical protein
MESYPPRISPNFRALICFHRMYSWLYSLINTLRYVFLVIFVGVKGLDFWHGARPILGRSNVWHVGLRFLWPRRAGHVVPGVSEERKG